MENMNENERSHRTNERKDQFDSFIQFERLSWEQIKSLDRKKTLFFLPISPLEEHGPHLPIGTDLLTAKETSIAAITKLKTIYPQYSFVLLPDLPIGFAGSNRDFPGTVSISSRIVQQVVYSYGCMLARNGFSHLLICSYHMALGHLKGIYKAIRRLRRKYHMIVCEPWSPVFYSDAIKEKEPKVDFDTSTEIHGGFRETSLMKYTHPELVDEGYKQLPLVYNEKIMTASAVFNTFKQLGITKGYIGTPSKADTTYGRWFFELTVNTYIEAAEKMIQNKTLPDLPKKMKRQMMLLFWL
jgi:creatinine amidohydrolase